MARKDGYNVLCVDSDHDIADVVQAALEDEGYRVSCLYSLEDDALMRTIGRLEPDVILLDGMGAEYTTGWAGAASSASRARPVPVVMFTADMRAVKEAREGTTKRAVDAHFAAILPKPFDLDELLEAVARAAGRSVPFDRSRAAEEKRTSELVRELKLRGATDVRPSKMREWALFRDQDATWRQLYWWQSRGVYQLGRYLESGEMVLIGQFQTRDAAIEVALPASDAANPAAGHRSGS